MNTCVILMIAMQLIYISGQPTTTRTTTMTSSAVPNHSQSDNLEDENTPHKNNQAHSSTTDSKEVAEEQIVRDITGDSDIEQEGMEVAESMVFRPLFAYRKQVLRRQRIRAEKRYGSAK